MTRLGSALKKFHSCQRSRRLPSRFTEIGTESKSDMMLRFMAIFAVIAYAWLLARLFEPRLEAPASLVSSVSWIEHGEFKNWQRVHAHRPRSVAVVAATLARLDGRIKILGGMASSIDLVVDADHERTYAVSGARIAIAESIVRAPGQLERAFIKAWLLQRGGTGATASILRREVLSDVLESILTGDEHFIASGSSREIHYPGVENWLSFARSFEASCGSPWASLEFHRACGKSSALNPLSFRPLLSSMLWHVVQTVSPWQRTHFVERWAEFIKNDHMDRRADRQRIVRPASLVEWQAWLAGEFSALLPVDRLQRELNLDGELKQTSVRMISRAELTNERVRIDAVIHRENHARFDLTRFSDRMRPFAIVSSDGEAWLMPGRVRLSDSDVKQAEVPFVAWESCRPMSLTDIFTSKVPGKKLFYVESCTPTSEVAWMSLLQNGVRGFAKSRPETPFLLLNLGMNREVLDLAVSRGQMNVRAPLRDLMTASRDPKRSLLGLEQAEWRAEIGAYRVLGAIEAVEWFRSPLKKM